MHAMHKINDYVEVYPLKWIADNSSTLEEVAVVLESCAAWCRERAAEGKTLAEPVSDGHIVLAIN